MCQCNTSRVPLAPWSTEEGVTAALPPGESTICTWEGSAAPMWGSLHLEAHLCGVLSDIKGSQSGAQNPGSLGFTMGVRCCVPPSMTLTSALPSLQEG